eukprot:6040512-Pleurochrysis_carterae.AAC.1
MHASNEMGRATTVTRIVRRARVTKQSTLQMDERDIPRDPRSAAMFCVVPVATNVKTMFYMKLYVIL